MKKVIIKLEPSRRLSAILGYPYYIERSFPPSAFGDLLTREDLEKMERGEEIHKLIPINQSREEEVENESTSI